MNRERQQGIVNAAGSDGGQSRCRGGNCRRKRRLSGDQERQVRGDADQAMVRSAERFGVTGKVNGRVTVEGHQHESADDGETKKLPQSRRAHRWAKLLHRFQYILQRRAAPIRLVPHCSTRASTPASSGSRTLQGGWRCFVFRFGYPGTTGQEKKPEHFAPANRSWGMGEICVLTQFFRSTRER